MQAQGTAEPLGLLPPLPESNQAPNERRRHVCASRPLLGGDLTRFLIPSPFFEPLPDQSGIFYLKIYQWLPAADAGALKQYLNLSALSDLHILGRTPSPGSHTQPSPAEAPGAASSEGHPLSCYLLETIPSR